MTVDERGILQLIGKKVRIAMVMMKENSASYKSVSQKAIESWKTGRKSTVEANSDVKGINENLSTSYGEN